MHCVTGAFIKPPPGQRTRRLEPIRCQLHTGLCCRTRPPAQQENSPCERRNQAAKGEHWDSTDSAIHFVIGGATACEASPRGQRPAPENTAGYNDAPATARRRQQEKDGARRSHIHRGWKMEDTGL